MYLNYSDGQRIRTGNKVIVANDGPAVVLQLIDPNDEAYAAWCAEMKLGPSIMLRSDTGAVSILDTTLGLERALTLVSRGS